MRISGNATQMQGMYEKMFGDPPQDLKGDPSAYPLSSFSDIVSNEHNIVGLLKKGLRDYQIHWSQEAQEEFENFRQNNEVKGNENVKTMSFETLIDNLIQKRIDRRG